jgi:hypothetical protein
MTRRIGGLSVGAETRARLCVFPRAGGMALNQCCESTELGTSGLWDFMDKM